MKNSILGSVGIACLFCCTAAVASTGVPVTLLTLPAPTTPAITLSALGEVQGIPAQTLTAPVTGTILGPFAPTGMVQAGTPLARIVPAGLAAQTQAAQAQLHLAAENRRRDRQLFRDGVISQQTLETSQATLAANRAALQALQAEAAQLQLRSPITGLLRYQVQPGSVVAAGTPIASISGRGHPWIQALLPPQQAQRLSAGAQVQVHSDDWAGTAMIHSIGQDARQSGLVAVILHLPANSPLLPGQWVDLRFARAEVGKKAYLLPSRAVVMVGAQSQVWVDHQGRATAIPVTVLQSTPNTVTVTGNLPAGEQIVLRGNTHLKNGSPLDPQQ